MPKPLEGGIAKQVAKGLKKAKLLKPAILIKVAPGVRGVTISAGTNATETPYSAKGFVADYTAFQVDGTLILAGDRKVALVGALIASKQVPAPNDKVTIEGATYRIIRVTRDPAAAIYACQARL